MAKYATETTPKRTKKLDTLSYTILGLLSLALSWACVFVPLLNPVRLKNAFESISFFDFYSTGSALIGQYSGLIATLLSVVAFVVLLHTVLFLFSTPSGKLAFVCRIIFLLTDILMILLYLGCFVIMLISGRFAFGGLLGAAACILLLWLALTYRPVADSSKNKKLRVVYSSVIALFALFFSYKLFFAPAGGGEIDLPTTPPVAETSYNDPDVEDSGNHLPFIGTQKKGMYTFILSGLDHNNYHTDNLMIARLDTINKKLDIVNIPRDTLVYVDDRPRIYQETKKINAAYLTGTSSYANAGKSKDQQRAQGIKLLRTELKTILGFVPNYYMIINLQTFVDIIDAVGGVDYDVKRDYDYDDASQGLHIHLKKGHQHLNGTQAIQLVRYRHDYKDGDIGRINEAQDFLMAVADQVLGKMSLSTMNKLVALLENEKNVVTDIPGDDLLDFFSQLSKVPSENVSFSVMPAKFIMYNRRSYAQVKGPEFVEMINDKLNPFNEKITLDNLRLLLVK